MKEVLEYEKVVQETGSKQVFCLSCNGVSKIERGQVPNKLRGGSAFSL